MKDIIEIQESFYKDLFSIIFGYFIDLNLEEIVLNDQEYGITKFSLSYNGFEYTISKILRKKMDRTIFYWVNREIKFDLYCNIREGIYPLMSLYEPLRHFKGISSLEELERKYRKLHDETNNAITSYFKKISKSTFPDKKEIHLLRYKNRDIKFDAIFYDINITSIFLPCSDLICISKEKLKEIRKLYEENLEYFKDKFSLWEKIKAKFNKKIYRGDVYFQIGKLLENSFYEEYEYTINTILKFDRILIRIWNTDLLKFSKYDDRSSATNINICTSESLTYDEIHKNFAILIHMEWCINYLKDLCDSYKKYCIRFNGEAPITSKMIKGIKVLSEDPSIYL